MCRYFSGVASRAKSIGSLSIAGISLVFWLKEIDCKKNVSYIFC